MKTAFGKIFGFGRKTVSTVKMIAPGKRKLIKMFQNVVLAVKKAFLGDEGFAFVVAKWGLQRDRVTDEVL